MRGAQMWGFGSGFAYFSALIFATAGCYHNTRLAMLLFLLGSFMVGVATAGGGNDG